MSSRRRSVPLALLFAGVGAGQALAWGAQGHREIGSLAIETLPAEVPAFLRTAAVAQMVGELAREPDRSRGAGDPHDHDLDPGHFVDLDDAGRINGGPLLSDLPPTREAYDAALRAVGSDSFKSGYLPYNIEEGYQQLAKDFAYWRVETAALKSSPAQDRAWIARDRTLREQLIVRDIGVWAHFVGDGSQPLHVSVHYNGWGPFPNPHGYTQDKLHGPFEGEFVFNDVPPALVRAAMKPYRPCTEAIGACTSAYLEATGHWVEPLYAMWGEGDFASATPKGVAFAAARLADGADELRDLIVDAWRASADGMLGRKPGPNDKPQPGQPPGYINVKAAEAGTPVPMGVLYGDD